MVKETRIILGPKDILQLRVQCAACHGVSLFPINPEFRLPQNCGYCKVLWVEQRAQASVNYSRLMALMQALVHFSTQEDGTEMTPAPFSVSFEIDADD